jgi:DNA modification methylase
MTKPRVKSKATPKIIHIDHAVVPKPHSSMYLMHKYWARKPHNVVSEYIKHYSHKGDIVFDPFSGSGVTSLESLIIKRKTIACDLDPVANFILKCTAMPVNIDKLKGIFSSMESALHRDIGRLYKTHCSDCQRLVESEAIIWRDNKPREIRYNCHCRTGKVRTKWKKPDKYDLDKISKINSQTIPHWYPGNELVWNSRVNVSKGMKVCDLFTRRNLIALSIICNYIEGIKDKKLKDFMKFCFSSSLAQSSKLVFIIRKRGRNTGEVKKTKEVGSWATRGYWIPPEYFEINAWNSFSERFTKLIRGKTETNKLIGQEISLATEYSEISTPKPLMLLTQSVTNLSNIPDNSIDYVFTDPPYGDSIPYSELNLMWASWLKMPVNFEDEIIISDSPVRKKDFEEYSSMLTLAFREVYRILKPSKWLTVTFHSTDMTIYNSIIRAVVFAGFKLDKIIYQPPARTSPKSLLAPYGSAVGDYYLRFYKPKKTTPVVFNESLADPSQFETIVVESVKGIIAERGEPVTYNDILKGIYPTLDKYGYLLIAKPEKIDEIIAKHRDIEFVFLKGKGWWLKNPAKYLVGIIPLNERVEQVVIQTLRRKNKVSLDEVLQDLFLTFQNGLTPNPPMVTSVLSEYATRAKDGKWKLKPSVEARENEHSKMIYVLSLIGAKLGYDIFSGHPTAVYESKQVVDIAGYHDITTLKGVLPDSIQKIRQIDVVWHKDKKIHSIFEVENSTGITESLVRAANIPYSINRYIVLPEERDALLQSRMKEPMLTEHFNEGNWKIIFYGRLNEFIEEYKRKHYILADFESIANTKPSKIQLTDTGQYTL